MSTDTCTTYGDYMAALGWPEHHVLLGVDWWACLCGQVATLGDLPRSEPFGAAGHASDYGAALVAVGYHWENVADLGPTVDELHEFLWGETDGFR